MEMYILTLTTVQSDMISIKYQNIEKWQYSEIFIWIRIHSLKTIVERRLVLYFMLTSRFISQSGETTLRMLLIEVSNNWEKLYLFDFFFLKWIHENTEHCHNW